MTNEELNCALEYAVSDLVDLENEKTGNLHVIDRSSLIENKINNYIEIARKKNEKFNMDPIDIEKKISKMKIGETIRFNRYFNITCVNKGYIISSKGNSHSMVFVPS
jgi:hypothetical protein